MVAMFAGVDMVIDNYSEARSAKALITQHQMVGVAIRHPVGSLTLASLNIQPSLIFPLDFSSSASLCVDVPGEFRAVVSTR